MLQNKTVMKAISLLIAVSLWGYVVWNDNPVIKTTYDNMPVQILNAAALEARGLTLLDAQDYTVSLKVQGKKKDIGSLDPNDISVTVDLGGYGEGEITAAVSVKTLDNISVVAVKPSKLTFQIDSIIEEEKTVRVSLSGEVPDNMEVEGLTSEPESVAVKGARTLVDRVAYVRAVADAASLSEDAASSVMLTPVDGHGEEITGVQLAEATAEITPEIFYTKTVPLSVTVTGEPAEGTVISHVTVPDELTVRGSRAALANVTEVQGTVDVSGITESGERDVALTLPQGISPARGEGTIKADVVTRTEAEPDHASDVPGEGPAETEE